MSEDEKSKKNSAATEGRISDEISGNNGEASPKTKSEDRGVIRGLILLFLALLFAFVFSHSELIAKLENITREVQMQLNQPEEDSNIVIVEITQESFKQDFKEQTRPLNPEVLHQLISALSKGHPCVIGVDIDTSFSQFKDFKVEESWKPYTIWARTALVDSSKDNEKPVALNVLGSQNLELNNYSGLAYVLKDKQDYVARQYARMIDTAEGKLPSFAWAIYTKGVERKCNGINFPELNKDAPPLFINYSRGPEQIRGSKVFASDILQNAGNNALANSTIFKDKIVLIGGSYLGEDRHETPLGEMLGVEIASNIIETELHGGGVKPLDWVTIGFISIICGIALIFIFEGTKAKFNSPLAFLISLGALLVFSLFFSWLMYRSISYWASFTPVMLGVYLAEVYDEFLDHIKVKCRENFSNFFATFKSK